MGTKELSQGSDCWEILPCSLLQLKMWTPVAVLGVFIEAGSGASASCREEKLDVMDGRIPA